MSMILINALGRRQALERCRRQEREAASSNAVARAVREEVERLCNPPETVDVAMRAAPASRQGQDGRG